MKKTLLAVALGAFAMASTATANWYVQGDVGASKTKINDIDLSKNHFEPRISIGYQLQDFRFAVDYTHYKNLKGSYDIDGAKGNRELKIRGVGFSAIYDIPVTFDLKPYIGARLAVNHFKLENNYTDNGWRAYRTYKDTELGFGAIVGAQYNLGNNLFLNTGVEYNRLGETDGAKVNNYGAKVGLRYNF